MTYLSGRSRVRTDELIQTEGLAKKRMLQVCQALLLSNGKSKNASKNVNNKSNKPFGRQTDDRLPHIPIGLSWHPGTTV